MAALFDESVVRYQLQQVCDRLLAALESNDAQALNSFGLEWQALTALVGDSLSTSPPAYSADLYRLAHEVANRIGTILRHFQQLAVVSEEAQVRLRAELDGLLSSAPAQASSENSGRGISTTPLALRQWFLDHIDEPYLDRPQTREMSDQLGVSVSSIKQFLINARRRSGWNDFRRTYGRDDRAVTGELIRRIRRLEAEPYLAPSIPIGAEAALDQVHRYVAAGLEVEVRDGLEEAMDAELRRIAEENEQRHAQAPTQPGTRSSKGKQPIRGQSAIASTSTALTTSTSHMSLQPDVWAGVLFPNTIQHPLPGTTSMAPTVFTSQTPGQPEAWGGALSQDVIQQLQDVLAPFAAQPSAGNALAGSSTALPLVQPDLDPAAMEEFSNWLEAQQQTVDQFTSSDAIDSSSAPMDVDQPPGSSPAGSLFSGEPTPGPPTPTAAQSETAPPAMPTSFVRSSSVPLSGLWGSVPRASNAPSDVAPPTWTITPAISSAPKAKRRSPTKKVE